jgi:hypothetical protein
MTDSFPDADKTEVISQFYREARILAGLKHPNLPRVFDCFEENNRHYLVMEYIEGLTLEEVFEKNTIIQPDKALDWAVQLCDVLASLHKEGIIYRDLKPGNVMVDNENRIYLIDFGIARLFSGGKIHDTIIIGTPGFASPEHHGRAETDARSDIFSLGATLHFLVTGVDPQLIPFVFKKPADLKPDIPGFFSDAIMKAVALDPADRFQTAIEMREAIVAKEPPVSVQAETPKISPATSVLTSEPVKEFSTDYIRAEAPGIAISGGIVATGAFILAGGVVTVPLLIGAVAACVPVAALTGKYMRKILKTPGNIRIVINNNSIRFERGEMKMDVAWNEVTGFLMFYEKAALNIMIKKYKIFTEKGNFEYGDEVGNVEELNELIIKTAGLKIFADSEGYMRYGRG